MDLTFIRQFFNVNTKYGWLLPLVIPVALWWLSTQHALKDVGLISQLQPREAAVATVNGYATTLKDFPGEPVISVHEERNGNKEARLVIRAMGERGVIYDAVIPFIFPALMGFVFSCSCCALILRFRGTPNDAWQQWAVDIVMSANLLALLWYFGVRQIWEFLSK